MPISNRLIAFTLTLACCTSLSAQTDETARIGATLDDFHQAASKADSHRYFSHFTDNGIFLGTDISERWTVVEFKAYADPHFKKGQGWTYRPQFRKIYLSEDGNTAWFDETLLNDKYGNTRGSGVLVKSQGNWLIAQYHLTLPVPNKLMNRVVEMIQSNP